MSQSPSNTLSTEFTMDAMLGIIEHVDRQLPIYCPFCGRDSLNESSWKPWCGEHSGGHKLAKHYRWWDGEAFFPCAECGKPREDEDKPSGDYLCRSCRAEV